MSDPKAFNSDNQNAIFNFLFALIDQYKLSMTPKEALDKACDWIISLGQTLKQKAETLEEENLAQQKLFDQQK